MDKISDKPLVVIHCFVYNYEPYLHDCFDDDLNGKIKCQ